MCFISPGEEVGLLFLFRLLHREVTASKELGSKQTEANRTLCCVLFWKCNHYAMLFGKQNYTKCRGVCVDCFRVLSAGCPWGQSALSWEQRACADSQNSCCSSCPRAKLCSCTPEGLFNSTASQVKEVLNSLVQGLIFPSACTGGPWGVIVRG